MYGVLIMGKEKHYNHIYRKIALIFYALAIIMIITGVALMASSVKTGIIMDDPNSMPENLTTPIALIVIGGLIFFIATVLLFIDFAKSKIFSGLGKGLIDKVVSTATYMQATYQDKLNEHKKKKTIFCSYCGTALDGTEKKCPNCGASNFKKTEKTEKN